LIRKKGLITFISICVVVLILSMVIYTISKSEEPIYEYRTSLLREHPLDSPEVFLDMNKYPEYIAEFEIMNDNCSKCHSTSRALNSNYIDDQWEKIVSKMILNDGSKISVSDGKKIIDFLKFFSTEKTKNPSKLLDKTKDTFLKKIDSNLSNAIESSKKSVNAEYGNTIYNNYCATCHGENGEGKIGLKLNNNDMMGIYLRDNAKFYRETIKMGRRGTLMKGWSYEYLGIFNSNQIENIIEFIRQNWYKQQTGKAKPTEYQIYEELKGANIKEGKMIYDNVCSSCHYGITLDSFAPDIRNYTFSGLNNQGEPLTIDIGQLRYIIKNGRNDTMMKPFGKDKSGVIELNDSQIDSIIKYLRSEPVIYK